MFQISPDSIPMGACARHLITSTYTLATDTDMVRIVETDGFHTHTLSKVFVERTPAEAMAQALAYMEVEWGKTSPLQTTIAYSDNQGSWCVECGNSVYEGEHGGQVCSNPSCQNYDPDNCPVWVKELHSVA